MSELVFVVAGTRAEFIDWCQTTRTPQSSVTYVTNPARQLVGIARCSVVLVGTYADRPDWGRIQEALAVIARKGELLNKRALHLWEDA